jgi:hypothetical protein
MKKTLLFVSALIAGFSSYAQYEGFENWTQNNLQTLDDYETPVNDRGVEGANACFPSTDAVTGTKSLRLETIVSPTNGDTIFGYIVSGDPDSGAPGQEVTLPVPGTIDSLIGWYKYDILAGDSAVILIGASALGTQTGGGTYYFSGQQLTWKRFAYYVNAAASDSIIFAAATGDPLNNFNGKPGSWVQFDDIQLKGPGGVANIDNYSFENWSTTPFEDLNGWTTENTRAIGSPTMPAAKSTDSYTGTYALELNQTLSNNGDTIWSNVTNGYWTNNGPAGGQPYSSSPTSVECYYKYTPNGTDSAFINFQFFQNGSSIANAGNVFPNSVSSYTLWTTPLNAMTPDTVLIVIGAGENIGSQFLIDHIDFSFPVGIAEGITVEKLVSYPNPTTDVLKIKFEILNNNAVTIRLIDVTGKQLETRSLGNLSAGTYRESFNTSHFTSGIYFIEFFIDGNKQVERFVVK